MNEIYAEYGYYRDVLDSFTLKDKDGLERIASMMEELKKETLRLRILLRRSTTVLRWTQGRASESCLHRMW